MARFTISRSPAYVNDCAASSRRIQRASSISESWSATSPQRYSKSGCDFCDGLTEACCGYWERAIQPFEIFAIKPNAVDAFARTAETTFADYRNAGMREAGVLVTLDAQNNFPQLPIRTDGAYLVWLGIASDDKKLETAFTPLVERSSKSLFATDLLRAEPEVVILDPTKRSRLRWIADDPK